MLGICKFKTPFAVPTFAYRLQCTQAHTQFPMSKGTQTKHTDTRTHTHTHVYMLFQVERARDSAAIDCMSHKQRAPPVTCAPCTWRNVNEHLHRFGKFMLQQATHLPPFHHSTPSHHPSYLHANKQWRGNPIAHGK